jgi:hypothetical protein
MVLSHDITEIVPGRFKGPAFKRGQVIRHEDVSWLRDLGKKNIASLAHDQSRRRTHNLFYRLVRGSARIGYLPKLHISNIIDTLAEL